MERHKDITIRKPEQLKKTRGRSIQKEIIDAWFELVKTILEDAGVLNNPDRLYNVDEYGFPLDPSRINVLCERNISHLYRIIGGRQRLNICISSNEFAAEMDDWWSPEHTVQCIKGWMDGTVFLDWFKNLFLKEIPPERPVVLVFDGHGSHISLEIVKTARENGVIILKLPPNTTHVLKPLDVGVYVPAKTSWEKVLIAFAGQNLGSALKKEKFPCLIK